MKGIRTLIIDNYDSFTFNLYQLIGQVNGEEPVVIRNDRYAWNEIAGLAFDNLVISPGPGRPERAADFGICRDAILRAEVPVLGVCLGHQGIGHCFGAHVHHAPEPMHGRVSAIRHDGPPLYAGIPQDFPVVRYHSLIVAEPLPSCLRGNAWTSDGILMGLAHRELPRFGIQFHPESICSEYGDLILKNFRDLTPRRQRWAYPPKARQITVVPHPRGSQRTPLSDRVHSRSIPFDTSKTAAAFATLYGHQAWAFWLDSSGEGPGMARFSFMGGVGGPLSALASYHHRTSEITVTQSGQSLKVKADIYTWLRHELSKRRCDSGDLPFDFNCGFVGYFGYELKAETGATAKHETEYPDALFLFADRMIAFDHSKSEAWILCYGPADRAKEWIDRTAQILANLPAKQEPLSPSSALTIHLDRDRAQYIADVRRCQEWIREGETYEICLTNRIRTEPIRDPLAFYILMRQVNPAPYSAFLRLGERSILSCSPERFLRIDPCGVVESKPIKGTRPRGDTPEEDEALRRDLAGNEKDRSENLMIVDLVRHDLGLVSEIGSVKVTKLMNVETYPTVHQLVSTVRGRLRNGIDASACIQAAFPGGSMTGAPKLRTMNLIDHIETSPRGVYSGSIGYLSLGGAADLNIVIRTLVCTPEESSFGVGGAVTALSDPNEEFEETLVKARALIHTLILNAVGHADRTLVDRAISDLRKKGHARI